MDLYQVVALQNENHRLSIQSATVGDLKKEGKISVLGHYHGWRVKGAKPFRLH